MNVQLCHVQNKTAYSCASSLASSHAYDVSKLELLTKHVWPVPELCVMISPDMLFR
jgi:hypothetical protein